jgi:hypothetical protein
MDELRLKLSFLERRIERIEEKLNQIPVPFKLMYKPPYEEEHSDIVDVLDRIIHKLKQLEDG